MPDVVSIAQTLHGYDDGHRLLARGGDLLDREVALLDRLTDLTGYIPPGFDFDDYLSGYSCGRYYALARTWHDRTGARRGTVLTHALLLPAGRPIGGSLEGLASLFRRPDSPIDRDAYRSTLEFRETTEVAPDALDETETAVLARLLSPREHPLLWLGEAQPERRLARLWASLPPIWRSKLTFCTMALGVPRHPAALFDLLFAPVEARTAFTGHVPKNLRVDLLEPELGQRMFSGGFAGQGVGEVQIEWTKRLMRWCDRMSVAPRTLRELATLERVRELEPLAHERVTAARSRMDLALHLWPDLSEEQPLSTQLLDDLLDTQPTAEGGPRPLWELTELLRRPLFRARIARDAAYAARASRTIEAEVLARLSRHGDGAWEALPSLLDVTSSQTPLAEALRRGLERAVIALAEHDPNTLFAVRIEGLPESLYVPLLVSAVRAVPGARLLDVVTPLAEARERGRNVTSAWVVLRERTWDGDDLTLVDALTKAEEADESTLHRLMSWAQRTRRSAIELSSVLARFPAAVRLAWALDCAEPSIRDVAIQVGLDAWSEQSLPLSSLISLAKGRPSGDAVVRRALRSTPSDARRDALRSEHELARSLAREHLAGASGAEVGELFDDSLCVLFESASGVSALQRVVAEAPSSEGRDRVAREGLARAFDAHVDPSASGDPLVEWLDLEPTRACLAQASLDELRSWLSGTREVGRQLPRIARCVRLSLSRKRGEGPWLASLLALPMRRAWAGDLDAAAEDLCEVLRIAHAADAKSLAAECLVAVRRDSPRRGNLLVIATFPRIYPELLDRERDPLSSAGWSWSGWDRAREWRRWLTDTWLSMRWPPADLLLALGGDVRLLRQVVVRLDHRWWAGRSLLEELRETLGQRRELAANFRGDALAEATRSVGLFEEE